MSGNVEVTLLPSAARTVATSSALVDNIASRGVIVILAISAASGAGGLQVKIQGLDPVSGNFYQLNASPTAIIAAGTYAYEIFPGSSTAGSAGDGLVNQRVSGLLPKTWRVTVAVGDSSSYTYSLTAVMLG